jgi:hypothetical protein
MTEAMTEQEAEARAEASARAAAVIVALIPMTANKFDADVGATALMTCGMIATRLVGKEPELMTQEEFISHMYMAIAATDEDFHPVQQ